VWDVRRLPSPPIVAAALSGFVVGVILTLLATGLMPSGAGSAHLAPTLPPATPVGDPQLTASVRRIVAHRLGLAYPAPKTPRLLNVDVAEAGPVLPDSTSPITPHKERAVYIRFRLNNHPLGRAWRLKAAKADVFAVMQALYTSQLPIYSVEMVGIFPISTRKGVKDEPVLVVYMDHLTASTVPWKRWGRESEGRLWAMLPSKYIDPRFA
jgi:hypothetical protein